MSTPIENNTEELRNILQQVNELPNAGNTPLEAVLYVEQTLTDEQKAQVQENIGVEVDPTLTIEGVAADAKAVGDAISKLSGGNVVYDKAQNLTNEQKAQARENIGIVGTGQDGKTPVKGEDYYTEADKEEMVNAVLSALPYGEGVKY